MKKILPNGNTSKQKRSSGETRFLATNDQLNELDARIELIQALIPLGLRAVQDSLDEVNHLAGERYSRAPARRGEAARTLEINDIQLRCFSYFTPHGLQRPKMNAFLRGLEGFAMGPDVRYRWVQRIAKSRGGIQPGGRARCRYILTQEQTGNLSQTIGMPIKSQP